MFFNASGLKDDVREVRLASVLLGGIHRAWTVDVYLACGQRVLCVILVTRVTTSFCLFYAAYSWAAAAFCMWHH